MGTREKEGEFYGRFGGLSTANMIYFVRRSALWKIAKKRALVIMFRDRGCSVPSARDVLKALTRYKRNAVKALVRWPSRVPPRQVGSSRVKSGQVGSSRVKSHCKSPPMTNSTRLDMRSNQCAKR